MARTLPIPNTEMSPLVHSLSDLGGLVRNQRAHGRLRIDDAAALSHVSADVLSRLENGKPVTLDKLMNVFEGLGLRMVVVSLRDVPAIEVALAGISHSKARTSAE